MWEGEHFILPPISINHNAVGTALDKLAAWFADSGWPLVIRDIEEPLAMLLDEVRPGYLSFQQDRDNFDYVYDVRALIDLKGSKYHTRKNQVNSFRRLYSDYQLLAMTEELSASCAQVAVEWAGNRDIADKNILYEQAAIVESLNNYIALGLTGYVIKINGRVVAFTIGERLNADTAVVHFEKADPRYKGIYAVLNRDFCTASWQDMKYINRQEDLGIPGLRKAKQSYHPVKMIKKYIAVAK